jgi:hypothetical protein
MNLASSAVIVGSSSIACLIPSALLVYPYRLSNDFFQCRMYGHLTLSLYRIKCLSQGSLILWRTFCIQKVSGQKIITMQHASWVSWSVLNQSQLTDSKIWVVNRRRTVTSASELSLILRSYSIKNWLAFQATFGRSIIDNKERKLGRLPPKVSSLKLLVPLV